MAGNTDRPVNGGYHAIGSDPHSRVKIRSCAAVARNINLRSRASAPGRFNLAGVDHRNAAVQCCRSIAAGTSDENVAADGFNATSSPLYGDAVVVGDAYSSTAHHRYFPSTHAICERAYDAVKYIDANMHARGCIVAAVAGEGDVSDT